MVFVFLPTLFTLNTFENIYAGACRSGYVSLVMGYVSLVRICEFGCRRCEFGQNMLVWSECVSLVRICEFGQDI